jgi:Peptidase A4 family
MRARLVVVALAVVAVSSSLVGLTSTAGAGTRARAGRDGGQLLVKTHSDAVLPVHGGTVDSLNWSGYAVTPAAGGITGVTSTFVVPAAAAAPPGFAATWTGIGGYSSSDLIQAGVSEDSAPGNGVSGSQYGAWYEVLPQSETPLTKCQGKKSCPVEPGDAVKVTITHGSGKHWTIDLADPTEGWTWTKTVTYASSESSAEWILEAPTVGAQTILANVGTVHFGPTSTYTAAGQPHAISQGDPTEIVLSPGGGVDEATPSALAADGQSFNDCAYADSCATP